MRKILLSALLLIGGIAFLSAQSREGLTEYKLDNGLTVMLWEDHDQPDVEGYVAVRAGAIDEPEEYTGLAHYLEHMLFKGTQRIGAIDWEKEKPYYEEIIKLYDQLAETTDEKARQEIITKINEASIEEAKYSTTEDFFNLMDGIGATGVNAYTSYDMTCYHNSFPANQMFKWLTIFSDRLDKPVFRTFQAELENVFEEYNMYEDGVSTQIRNHLFEELYKGHPYERNVIGKPEHLKNPRLSKLIEFFNTWYVPNNMALILVGDFNTEEVKPMIAQTFGRMQSKPLPERKQYPDAKFQANAKKKFNIGYGPQVIWAYDGIKVTDEDATVLSFVCSLLNNSSNTGLLDKITLDGEVSGAGVSLDARRDMGRILVFGEPYYDVNQRSYESNAATEKIIMREVDKIKRGDIPEWLIKSVKAEYAQNYALAFEEGAGKMSNLVTCFIYQIPTNRIFEEQARIQALTKEEIAAIAKKYFNAPHMTIMFEEGDPKANKLPKPKIKPLDMPKGVVTEYAKEFRALPSSEVKQTFMDMNDVQVVDIDKDIKLHYTHNDKNNIFSLILRYGVGTEKKPMLEYVTALMNRAGVMPDMDSQAFRRRLSELGGRCAYGVSGSYLTIQIIGDDAHMKEICDLVNRQILMPKLDEKQFDAVKGMELISRLVLKKQKSIWASALREYVLYDKKSKYIDVVPFMDVYGMDMTKLKTEFLDAIKYAANIHYCGTHTIEEVKAALPLQEGVKPSTSPEIRDRKSYDKTQIFFLPNNKVQQATVYFYFNGKPYSIDQEVDFEAFNQYFSGGFSGLVLDEIRTKRSMAYTAWGQAIEGGLPGKDAYFMGYIGTQSDKVVEAVKTFMHLLDSMPENPERLETLKATLRQEAQISKPSMRGKSLTYESWRLFGYKDDPARVNKLAIDNLTFEQIVKFYKDNIQGKPVSIIIMGDPKQIDKKELGKIGKVKTMSASTLFAPLDDLF